MPVIIVTIILRSMKREVVSKIVWQIFSVITQVKNGIIAVKRRKVLRAVQVVAKQERPVMSKKTGINMLEKP